MNNLFNDSFEENFRKEEYIIDNKIFNDISEINKNNYPEERYLMFQRKIIESNNQDNKEIVYGKERKEETVLMKDSKNYIEHLKNNFEKYETWKIRFDDGLLEYDLNKIWKINYIKNITKDGITYIKKELVILKI